MPFLLNFISKIKHESALRTLARVQRENTRIDLPFEGMSNTEEGAFLRPGDRIDLIGTSGSGKSTVMVEIAKHSLIHSRSHILYFDLDERLVPLDDNKFHLFHLKQGQTPSATLEYWLNEAHANFHVLWVMIDNTSCVDKGCWQKIKELQTKWGFILLTSTPATAARALDFDYRFEMSVTKGNEIQMQPIWPMHKDAFLVRTTTTTTTTAV